MDEVYEELEDMLSDLCDKVDELIDKIEELGDGIEDKVEDAVSNITSDLESAVEDAAECAINDAMSDLNIGNQHPLLTVFSQDKKHIIPVFSFEARRIKKGEEAYRRVLSWLLDSVKNGGTNCSNYIPLYSLTLPFSHIELRRPWSG
jgi:hypothetical protein